MGRGIKRSDDQFDQLDHLRFSTAPSLSELLLIKPAPSDELLQWNST